MGADDWPRHDNKSWQEVLDRVRALGWPRPAWTSNHPTLVMDCPEADPQCRIRAFSTGKGTESVAIQALRRVNRCPHRRIIDELTHVDELLDNASRFIDSAAELLRRGVIDHRLDELLTHASASIERAEAALLDQEFDDLSDELGTMDSPASGSVEDLLDSANRPLREARLSLRDLPGRSEEVKERQDRLERLTVRRNTVGDALHE